MVRSLDFNLSSYCNGFHWRLLSKTMSLSPRNREGIGGAQEKKWGHMAWRYSSGLGENCGWFGQRCDSEGGKEQIRCRAGLTCKVISSMWWRDEKRIYRVGESSLIKENKVTTRTEDHKVSGSCWVNTQESDNFHFITSHQLAQDFSQQSSAI